MANQPGKDLAGIGELIKEAGDTNGLLREILEELHHIRAQMEGKRWPHDYIVED